MGGIVLLLEAIYKWLQYNWNAVSAISETWYLKQYRAINIKTTLETLLRLRHLNPWEQVGRNSGKEKRPVYRNICLSECLI